MLQRHAHRAEHLVQVIDHARRAFLRMRSRERSVAGIAGRRRLQRQPAHAAGQHRALGESMAQRLEGRSEEHTSELQSLMRISYAVFCLKKKKTPTTTYTKHTTTGKPTIRQ